MTGSLETLNIRRLWRPPILRLSNFGLCLTFFLAFGPSPALATLDQSQISLERFVEARLAESSGEPLIAASIYAEGLAAAPDNELLAAKAYVKAIEVGNFDLALKAVNSLQLRGKADAEMPLLQFIDAYNNRDWQSAENAIVELEALKNFAFLAPFLETWMAVEKGDNAQAIFARTKENTSSNFYHYEQLVLLNLATGNDRDAIQLLTTIVERNEARMAPVRVIAARHFWSKNDPETALKILQFRRSGPEQKLFRQIENGEKRRVARRVNGETGLGFLFQRLSNDLAAQRAQFLSLLMAQLAYRLEPKSDYTRLTLGRAYAGAEFRQLAVAEFAEIKAESPYFLAGISSEIASLVSENKYDQAQQRLSASIERDTASPQLQVLKGQVLQARGDYAAAADAFAQAIILAENIEASDALLANYWLALGGAQEQAGIWPEGLESLRKANELLPNSPSILNYLGYAQLERLENKQEAIAAIREAHALRPSSPAITDSLGWAYFVIGEADQAVVYLEQALAGEPQDPTINEHLGDAYWTLGRKYEARYAWKSAKLFAEDEDFERLASKIEVGLQSDKTSP